MKISKWIGAGAAIAGSTYAAYAAITWLRYGRHRRPRGDEVDVLLDSFMPSYDVCERRAIAVKAPADITLAAAKDLTLDDSVVIRGIFKGRELLLHSKPSSLERARGLYYGMQELGWCVLAETENEIVFGAATRPWDANPVFRRLWTEEFADFAEPGYVKIIWTLRADPEGVGTTTFRTETRVVATDDSARAKFRRYWALLSPGIIAIRLAMLPALKAAAEARARTADAEPIEGFAGAVTRAETNAAPTHS
jgi:hypothetical protein